MCPGHATNSARRSRDLADEVVVASQPSRPRSCAMFRYCLSTPLRVGQRDQPTAADQCRCPRPPSRRYRQEGVHHGRTGRRGASANGGWNDLRVQRDEVEEPSQPGPIQLVTRRSRLQRVDEIPELRTTSVLDRSDGDSELLSGPFQQRLEHGESGIQLPGFNAHDG